MSSKRSREASFSPSASLPSSDASPSDAGLDEAAHAAKKSAVSDAASAVVPAMQCSMPPHAHAVEFDTIDAFEVHYAKDHSNRSLHLDEHHDPFRAELQAKGEKTYGCFVEGCEKKCSTAQTRRLHLIDKHAFPKVYNFHIVERGIDHASSMLQESKSHRRRVSTCNAPADAAVRRRRASSQLTNGYAPETAQQKASDTKGIAKPRSGTHGTTEKALHDLEKSMSALQFVPASVTRHQMRRPTE